MKPPVPLSNFRDRVTLGSLNISKDSMGGLLETPVIIRTFWAAVRQVRQNVPAIGLVDTKLRFQMVCRFAADISSASIIRVASQWCRIVEMKEVGTSEWLEITLEPIN